MSYSYSNNDPITYSSSFDGWLRVQQNNDIRQSQSQAQSGSRPNDFGYGYDEGQDESYHHQNGNEDNVDAERGRDGELEPLQRQSRN